MKIRKGTVVVAILLAFTVSVSALSQRRNQQQQQQQQQRGGQADAQAQQLSPQPTSKEELDAFVALQSEQTAAAKLAKGDEFVAKFPTSDFISYAHTFRMMSLTQMGKHKESAAAAEEALNSTIKLGEKMIAKADADSKLTDKDKDNARKKDKNVVFLDKNSPQFQQFMSQMDQRIMAFYQSMIQSYQQVNDAAKMMEVADKALAYKPDDLNTLVMLSNVMAERPPTNEDQKKTHLARAKFGFGSGGDSLWRRKAGEACTQRRFAEALAQQGDDLADLHNLFGGRENKRGETFPWILPEQAQARATADGGAHGVIGRKSF